MCLKVTHVPIKSEVVKCFKTLQHVRYTTEFGLITKMDEAKYYTPYYVAPIGQDGWLFPTLQKPSKEVALDQLLGCGYIHAMYGNIISNGYNLQLSNHSVFDAFAFGVVAYSVSKKFNSSDLACRALYIPELDTTERKDSILEILNGEYVSNKKLIELIPRLKRIKKYLLE